jgi:phage terminase Nu1 subunit (DNA packaging protein)
MTTQAQNEVGSDETVFWTPRQLADKAQVNVRTITRWRAEGIPFVRFGRKTVRYPSTDVLKWIQNR